MRNIPLFVIARSADSRSGRPKFDAHVQRAFHADVAAILRRAAQRRVRGIELIPAFAGIDARGSADASAAASNWITRTRCSARRVMTKPGTPLFHPNN